MFNSKNKKPNEISLGKIKPKDKSGVVANKGAAMAPRENKDDNKNKSAMQSEDGKN